jgi:hypothetical protein
MNKFPYQFATFQKEHISQVAGILANQSTEMRKRFPLLPSRIQDKETARIFVQALYEKSGGKGCVMLQQDEIVGFMLGYYDSNYFFGSHVWVPFGGMALPGSKPYAAWRAYMLRRAISGSRMAF